jgi:hypothetical protein
MVASFGDCMCASSGKHRRFPAQPSPRRRWPLGGRRWVSGCRTDPRRPEPILRATRMPSRHPSSRGLCMQSRSSASRPWDYPWNRGSRCGRAGVRARSARTCRQEDRNRRPSPRRGPERLR